MPADTVMKPRTPYAASPEHRSPTRRVDAHETRRIGGRRSVPEANIILALALLAVSHLSAGAAGKQLSGPYTPTPTPALSPEEAQKKFMVPDGFEVRLFAAEPDVVNPVAMTWDERGRLWVLELYEYPLGAAKGEKPRDRIKILEDSDADGRADKVTVFAEGFSLATGLALGNGGVYVGQAPDFLFLEDTDGDDKADKKTMLKT